MPAKSLSRLIFSLSAIVNKVPSVTLLSPRSIHPIAERFMLHSNAKSSWDHPSRLRKSAILAPNLVVTAFVPGDIAGLRPVGPCDLDSLSNPMDSPFPVLIHSI
jgi:hypothetical protein